MIKLVPTTMKLRSHRKHLITLRSMRLKKGKEEEIFIQQTIKNLIKWNKHISVILIGNLNVRVSNNPVHRSRIQPYGNKHKI